MTDQAKRPLLSLDVDGPLLPFGQDPPRELKKDAGPHPQLARLNPEVGIRLAALPCELVWAKTLGRRHEHLGSTPDRAATAAGRELAGAIR
ncbi:hypothetical protein SAMN04487981_104103 [Streptomyces sp. cf386]|uniref:hypothetical protein n=1 Tax=Streptomyces sp. cf386 TaxID=1761904 RepID=UPI00087EEB50|nr:hypothetical protein SAMN04487981_104103 [Streptomyces sp. cf386]